MAAVGTKIDSIVNEGSKTSLAQEVSTYYEKVFLARAEMELILKEGGQIRTHPVGEGRSVNFTRYNPLTIITEPVAEAANPFISADKAAVAAITLSEYGLTT